MISTKAKLTVALSLIVGVGVGAVLCAVFAFVFKDKGKCTPDDCLGKIACALVHQYHKSVGSYRCLSFQNDECTAIDNNVWFKNVSLIFEENDEKSCVRFYKQENCTGDYAEIIGNGENERMTQSFEFSHSVISSTAWVKSASACKRARGHPWGAEQGFRQCNSSDCLGKAACATIYQYSNLSGLSHCIAIEDAECSNLDSNWMSNHHYVRVKSAEGHGGCVRLYNFKNCRGPSIDIETEDTFNYRTENALFAGVVRSLSSCKRNPPDVIKIDFNWTGECTEADCKGQEACATIYSDSRFGGASMCLRFLGDECISIKGPMFTSDEISAYSFDNHKTCLSLYWGENCDTTFMKKIDVQQNVSESARLAIGFYKMPFTNSYSACKRDVS